ncbi:MAG: hypothetical protein N2327_06595 [Caldimicrobium sp.]|nr:hypothetical protein [Caldimicrobium sp.]MCX7874081.1 hypothetical protein [Caldimicrobium sp.]
MRRVFLVLAFLILLLTSHGAYCKEVPFTLEDRDRIIRIETKLAEIDKRFEQMMTFMWMLVGIFTGITAATIGFAIWDRRTMIRPFEIKTKLIEDEIGRENERLDLVIEALRNLAKTDEKVTEILKRFNLM